MSLAILFLPEYINPSLAGISNHVSIDNSLRHHHFIIKVKVFREYLCQPLIHNMGQMYTHGREAYMVNITSATNEVSETIMTLTLIKRTKEVKPSGLLPCVSYQQPVDSNCAIQMFPSARICCSR